MKKSNLKEGLVSFLLTTSIALCLVFFVALFIYIAIEVIK